MSVSMSQTRLQSLLAACGAALAGILVLGAAEPAEAGDRHRHEHASVVFDFDNFRFEFRNATHRHRNEWKRTYYREIERQERRVADQRRAFEREQRRLVRLERELENTRSKRYRRAFRNAYRDAYDDWWRVRNERPRRGEYCPRTGRRIGA